MESSGIKSMRFKHKRIIVTGASSGIGRAISKRLSVEGAELLVIGRNADQLKNLCEEISTAGGYAKFLVCDLSKEENRKTLCESISEIWHDKIDILINAAGIYSMEAIRNNTPDLWYQLMEINVIAPADLLSKLVLKLAKGAVVVNISSVAGIVATPGSSVYASTKAAILSFTRSAAAELAKRGIRVNAILPGMVKTPMMETMFRFFTKEQQIELEKRHLLGFGTVEDIASAVSFIASHEAKWITGCAFVVDGGLSLS
ncbi:MAG: SDR family oxidoreductase [Candidatus Brocadiaceae bacterium]|nr:SDR family oxidoreductase [Candidatus Brocadiaceae bacterium]